MPTTASKRQKEMARIQRRKEKEQERARRSEEKARRPQRPDGVDPDIEGIVPGPQPLPYDVD
jgi:hypothetical protein